MKWTVLELSFLKYMNEINAESYKNKTFLRVQ